MKKHYKISSLAAVFVFSGLVFLVLSGEAQFSMTTVEDSAFADRQRMKPLVSFTHDEHNEAAGIENCNTCHHVWEDGELLPDQSSIGMECSDCHLSDPGDTHMDLIRAYHLQCRDCHMEQKAGPITCSGCHNKEE